MGEVCLPTPHAAHRSVLIVLLGHRTLPSQLKIALKTAAAFASLGHLAPGQNFGEAQDVFHPKTDAEGSVLFGMRAQKIIDGTPLHLGRDNGGGLQQRPPCPASDSPSRMHRSFDGTCRGRRSNCR
jgi:hypothetical protein